MQKPTALAMIICDEVLEDKRTDKKSLIGIFSQINARKIPFVHPRLHVFLALTNGRGKYKVSLEYCYLKDLKVIGQLKGDLELKNPTDIFECVFELKDVHFSKEGLYNFQFSINDEPVIERKFNVSQLK